MSKEENGLVVRVEEVRSEKRLTQAEVAAACGLTQGHYSKLSRGQIEPGRRASDALGNWLVSQGEQPPAAWSSNRVEVLAASIREQCAELVRLARRARTQSAKDTSR